MIVMYGIKHLLICSLFAGTVLCACSEEEIRESAYGIQIPGEEIYADDASQSIDVPVTVTGNASWAVSSITGDGWLTSDPPAGTYNDESSELSIMISENTGQEERTAYITVGGYHDDGNGNVLFESVRITVSQMGQAPYLTVDRTGDEWLLSKRGNNNLSISVRSNVAWTAVAETADGTGWIELVQSEGDKHGSVIFNAVPNPYEQARSAKITITASAYDLEPCVVNLVQEAYSEDIAIQIDGMTGAVSPGEAGMELQKMPEGETFSVPVVVEDSGSSTAFVLEEPLQDGEYNIVKIVYESGSECPIDAMLSVSGEVMTAENYDAYFKAFGGDSPERPLKIASASDLKTLSDAVAAGMTYSGVYFLQTEDIDLSSLGEENWTPVGNASVHFGGCYDGGNHKVSGLHISHSVNTSHGNALFGYIEGKSAEEPCVICNLEVLGSGTSEYDINVSAGGNAGIAGVAVENLHIYNCVSRVNIRSGGSSCGGIVGMNETRKERAGLIASLANLDPQPESVPINQLVKVEGTPMMEAEELDWTEFVRTVAVARITMPNSYVRLSAGRHKMPEAMQALCFMAGANSIFYGDKLLVTGNNEEDHDQMLMTKLDLVPETL